MKARNFIAAVIIIGSIACIPIACLAQPQPSTAPSCGKTVEECQKQVDALQTQIRAATQQVQAYRTLAIEANDRLVQQATRPQP